MYSSLRKIEFDEHDAIRIINPKQAAFYWNKGLEPISIYPSNDHKTGEPLLVFLFQKSRTKELFDEWCKRKTDNSTT